MKVLRNSSQAARVMYGNVSRAFLRVANWSSAIRMRLCERLCAIHEAENARLLFTKWQNSIQSAWAQSNTFCACLEGAYIIDKTINALHDRASSFMHRSRVGAVKYLLCMSRRRLYYWQNDRYATWPCLPVLCIEHVAGIEILSGKHCVVQIARRRRKILLFKIIVPCPKTRF